MDPVVVVENLAKSYEKFPIFSNLSFTIKKGSTTGIIGPNGAGKTTLYKSLLGFTKVTRGTISLLDRIVFMNGKFNMQALYQAHKHIGYVPDKSFFYEYLSVREYLQLAAVLADMPNEGQKNYVEYLLQEFKLHRWAERMISTLSTGNRQRLALASAFIIRPELLFLDEPMNGLDPSGHRNFIQLLENYHNGSIPELGIAKAGTVVISSHNLEDIYRICTDIIVLSIYGEIVASGSVSEIKNRFTEDTTLEEIYLEILDENDARPDYAIGIKFQDEHLH